ncbi:MAG TPA: tellurite resistance TerB family protein [Stellaceae bacterium]|nr:tellurite resistance TerB family protein [Stellaceae bacterium]
MLDHHSALIYTMVLASAADTGMGDAEVHVIGDAVKHLPIFSGYDDAKLTKTLAACADLVQKDDGLDLAIKEIKAALPPRLRETAYALACDVIASDGEASQEELRLLEMLRDRLSIDRLVAAAIERAARARFMTI